MQECDQQQELEIQPQARKQVRLLLASAAQIARTMRNAWQSISYATCEWCGDQPNYRGEQIT